MGYGWKDRALWVLAGVVGAAVVIAAAGALAYVLIDEPAATISPPPADTAAGEAQDALEGASELPIGGEELTLPGAEEPGGSGGTGVGGEETSTSDSDVAVTPEETTTTTTEAAPGEPAPPSGGAAAPE